MANHRSDIMLLGYLLRIMAKIFVRDLQYTPFLAAPSYVVFILPVYLVVLWPPILK